MRTFLCFGLLLFVASSAFAQTNAPVTVSIETVRPNATCSIQTPSIDLDFGSVTIPWAGAATKDATAQVGVSVADASTVTASLSKTTLDLEPGKVSVALSLNAPSKTVTPSSQPQTVSFTVSGTATVQAGATPNTYNDNSTQLSISCSN